MKRIFNPVWAILVTLAVGLASCGPTAYIEKDPGLNLGDYRSFGWSEKKIRIRLLVWQNSRYAMLPSVN